jgi:type III pantothenate kinase
MILVIDVGNTNTVLGAMKDGAVLHRWRISTTVRTTDEMGLLLLQLIERRGLMAADIHGVAVSCVVPSVLYAIEKASKWYLKLDALVVSKGVKTGMRVCTDNPREVGADRIVNSVAVFEQYRTAAVVVDFGTATTLDCITPNGDYIGGVIAPGFKISADALFSKTAKLPKVEVYRTEKVIGTNTIHSMQSGMYWGYVGLVDKLAQQCKKELMMRKDISEVICVATGGLSSLIGQECVSIDSIDRDLTLKGLWLLFERNRVA